MVLIIILLCLAIQRFADLGGWFNSSWFEAYLGLLKPLINKCNKWVAILLTILPVFVVLIILQLLLLWRLFDLFYLIFASIILLFCMDARNIKNQLSAYFSHIEKQELEAARKSLNEFCDDVLPKNIAELSRKVTTTIFLRTFTHIFSVLFWFLICGIYGAVGYYLIALLRKLATNVDGSLIEVQDAAGLIQDILDWVPVRLLGLSYALVGNFTHGFAYTCKHFKLGIKDNTKFAIESGLAALGANLEDVKTANVQENQAALALIDRTLIVWIIAIALVIFGMML